MPDDENDISKYLLIGFLVLQDDIFCYSKTQIIIKPTLTSHTWNNVKIKTDAMVTTLRY